MAQNRERAGKEFEFTARDFERVRSMIHQRAGIALESDVEIVVYPPPRSFYEILSAQLSGASALERSRLAGTLSPAELQVLRVLRGPLDLFRNGEPLALLPVGFLR